MTDIHCHILPDVDDGAADLEAAAQMARMAADCGVHTIIATPHFFGVPESLEELPRIRERFEALQGLPVRLILGAEVLCVPETLELARRGKLPTLGDSPWVLAEFYFDASAEFMDDMLFRLRGLGYRPIVAHPERYEAVQRDLSLAEHWFRRGYGIQLNKGSILGAFGGRAGETARRLLHRGLVHVIASDAHGPEVRTTDLDRVRRWCLEHLGREYTHILLEDNPGRIADGRHLRRQE